MPGFKPWTAVVRVYEAEDIPMCHGAIVMFRFIFEIVQKRKTLLLLLFKSSYKAGA